jgi:mycothiol synthase
MAEARWPAGSKIRAPRPDEAQKVADLICACDIADTGEPDWGVEETRGDWNRLGFDPARDARIVEALDGRIVAYTDVFVRQNAVEVAANTCLHPEFRSPELDEALIVLGESLAAQHAPLPVRQMVAAPRGHIFEARGYKPQRWLWRMRGDLTQPPAPPAWPAGFGVRTMEPADEPRCYELIEEAFTRPDRGRVAYEEWRRFIVEREDFDRSLAFLTLHGDEIVGTAMCLMYPETHEGWVRQLAVDSRYRGRGLGKALLLHAFGEFYRRGATRSGLGVDANNPSATKLYLGVGMWSLQEYVQYERPAST